MDDDTKRELAVLKQYFEMLISNNEASRRQSEESHKEALSVALASNDKRLDGMNEFRAALGDQAGRMMTRHEFDTIKATLLEKSDQLKIATDTRFQAEIKPIAARLEQIGKPNWTLIISAISIFFVMVTGVWLVIGLKIDATVAPMALGLAAVQGAVAANTAIIRTAQEQSSAATQATTQGRIDRAQLNERVRTIETNSAANLGERRAQFGLTEAKLVEIETQFCSSDVIRNLMHANDLRLFAMLWHKAYPDTTLPTDNAFYPRVCQVGTRQSEK